MASNSPRFVTLSVKATGLSLNQAMEKLYHSFRNLRRHQEWKRRVKGGIWCVEVTFNEHTGDWHPHLHIIVDGEYFPQTILSDCWLQATGDSPVADIRAVHDREGAARYLAKYAAKPARILELPDLKICEYAVAMEGKRCIHTFGNLHNVQVDPREDEEMSKASDRLIGASKLRLHVVNKNDKAIYSALLLQRLGGSAAQIGEWCLGFASQDERPLTELEVSSLKECLVELAELEPVRVPIEALVWRPPTPPKKRKVRHRPGRSELFADGPRSLEPGDDISASQF